MKARNNFDFYEIALKELMKINYRREIIPFPLVFNRLGTMFHFDKRSSLIVLKNLERRGHVEMIPFKGIRILVGNSIGFPKWIRKSAAKHC